MPASGWGQEATASSAGWTFTDDRDVDVTPAPDSHEPWRPHGDVHIRKRPERTVTLGAEADAVVALGRTPVAMSGGFPDRGVATGGCATGSAVNRSSGCRPSRQPSPTYGPGRRYVAGADSAAGRALAADEAARTRGGRRRVEDRAAPPGFRGPDLLTVVLLRIWRYRGRRQSRGLRSEVFQSLGFVITPRSRRWPVARSTARPSGWSSSSAGRGHDSCLYGVARGDRVQTAVRQPARGF